MSCGNKIVSNEKIVSDVLAELITCNLIFYTSELKRSARYTTHEKNLFRAQDEADRCYFHALIYSLGITFVSDYVV